MSAVNGASCARDTGPLLYLADVVTVSGRCCHLLYLADVTVSGRRCHLLYPADIFTYCIRQILSLTVSGRCHVLYPADIVTYCIRQIFYPADVTYCIRQMLSLYLTDVVTYSIWQMLPLNVSGRCHCIWQMSLTVSGRCHLPMLFPRACWLSVKSTTLTRKASRQTVTFVK